MNKYQEAIERMEESYFNCDNCLAAMRQFSADRDLLWNLVNVVEQREEDMMKAFKMGYEAGCNNESK